MTRHVRPPRRDANEREIIDALVRAGAWVTQLDTRDVPDLLVGYRGAWHLLEVKIPLGPKGGSVVAHQSLSEGQVDFFAKAAARGLPVTLVRSPQEALRAVGALDSVIGGPRPENRTTGSTARNLPAYQEGDSHE